MPYTQVAHGAALLECAVAVTPARMLAVLDARERSLALTRQDGRTEIPSMLRAGGLLQGGPSRARGGRQRRRRGTAQPLVSVPARVRRTCLRYGRVFSLLPSLAVRYPR